jgi:hypothetical protein
MLLTIIILAYLLANTWLTLLIALPNEGLDGWDDLGAVVLCTLFTPFVVLLVSRIYCSHSKKYHRRKRD